jgi:hypothetical protein
MLDAGDQRKAAKAGPTEAAQRNFDVTRIRNVLHD